MYSALLIRIHLSAQFKPLYCIDGNEYEENHVVESETSEKKNRLDFQFKNFLSKHDHSLCIHNLKLYNILLLQTNHTPDYFYSIPDQLRKTFN